MRLDPERIAEILLPFGADLTGNPRLLEQLEVYLGLLLRWNARTNLTAIREPEEIVRRHFGESLFLANHMPHSGTMLDLGSGAGFPGIPIQLVRPGLAVTLAESQGKKVSFLREVIRTLGLSTAVWPERAEKMPRERSFDVATLRAVDRMDSALAEACRRSELVYVLGGASVGGKPPCCGTTPPSRV